VGECLDRHSESAGKTEISKLEDACLLVDEDVLRFQVTVDDSPRMAVVEPIEDLKEVVL
jgi:hypothetical protein